MSNRNGLMLAVVLFFVLIAGFVGVFALPNPQPTQNLSSGSNELGQGSASASSTSPVSSVAVINNLIEVTSPLIGATVSSPITLTGSARGTWYFEASAPYELRDSKGTLLAQGHVDAQGDWMTEDFVPFKATITFTKQPAGSVGTLILHNDNPSGDPERNKTLEIPIKF